MHCGKCWNPVRWFTDPDCAGQGWAFMYLTTIVPIVVIAWEAYKDCRRHLKK